MPDDLSLDDFEEKVRERYQIPHGLWSSLKGQENASGDPSETSPTGVKGRFQLTKATGRAMGVNRDDPFEQAVGAARYLREGYDKYPHIKDENQRWLAAAGRYYGGDDAVANDGTLSTKSRDGLSTPAKYVTGIATKWGEFNRSQQQSSPTPSNGARPSNRLAESTTNTVAPNPPRKTAPPPRPDLSSLVSVGHDDTKPQLSGLDIVRHGVQAQQGQAPLQRQARQAVHQRKVDQARRDYEQRSALGQLGQNATEGLVQGFDTLANIGNKIYGGLGAIGGGEYEEPIPRLSDAAKEDLAIRAEANQGLGAQVTRGVGQGLPSLPLYVGAGMLGGPAGVAGVAGLNALQEDFKDPLQSAANVVLNTAVPLGAGKVVGAAARPLLRNLPTPSLRFAGNIGSEAVGGAAGNVGTALAEGITDPQQLTAQALIGAATSAPFGAKLRPDQIGPTPRQQARAVANEPLPAPQMIRPQTRQSRGYSPTEVIPLKAPEGRQVIPRTMDQAAYDAEYARLSQPGGTPRDRARAIENLAAQGLFKEAQAEFRQMAPEEQKAMLSGLPPDLAAAMQQRPIRLGGPNVPEGGSVEGLPRERYGQPRRQSSPPRNPIGPPNVGAVSAIPAAEPQLARGMYGSRPNPKSRQQLAREQAENITNQIGETPDPNVPRRREPSAPSETRDIPIENPPQSATNTARLFTNYGKDEQRFDLTPDQQARWRTEVEPMDSEIKEAYQRAQAKYKQTQDDYQAGKVPRSVLMSAESDLANAQKVRKAAGFKLAKLKQDIVGRDRVRMAEDESLKYGRQTETAPRNVQPINRKPAIELPPSTLERRQPQLTPRQQKLLPAPRPEIPLYDEPPISVERSKSEPNEPLLKNPPENFNKPELVKKPVNKSTERPQPPVPPGKAEPFREAPPESGITKQAPEIGEKRPPFRNSQVPTAEPISDPVVAREIERMRGMSPADLDQYVRNLEGSAPSWTPRQRAQRDPVLREANKRRGQMVDAGQLPPKYNEPKPADRLGKGDLIAQPTLTEEGKAERMLGKREKADAAREARGQRQAKIIEAQGLPRIEQPGRPASEKGRVGETTSLETPRAPQTEAAGAQPVRPQETATPEGQGGTAQESARPEVTGRKINHSRFGAVTEAADQQGVPKGKLRVIQDSDGQEKIIQNPRTRGNREAAFVKSEPKPKTLAQFVEAQSLLRPDAETQSGQASQKQLKPGRQLGPLNYGDPVTINEGGMKIKGSVVEQLRDGRIKVRDDAGEVNVYRPEQIGRRGGAQSAAKPEPLTKQERSALGKMYHGTSSPTAFESPKGRSWFTSDPNFASDYAAGAHVGGPEGPQRIYPASLEIKRPYRVKDRLEQVDLVNDADRVNDLERKGYDGIIRTDEDGKVIALPFKDSQITSKYQRPALRGKAVAASSAPLPGQEMATKKKITDVPRDEYIRQQIQKTGLGGLSQKAAEAEYGAIYDQAAAKEKKTAPVKTIPSAETLPPQKVAAPKPAPSRQPTPGGGNERAILDAMVKVKPEALQGGLTPIRDMRAASGLSPEQFDAVVKRMVETEELTLHRHDHPASLTDAQRAEMVRMESKYGDYTDPKDGKKYDYYIGAALRNDAGSVGEALGRFSPKEAALQAKPKFVSDAEARLKDVASGKRAGSGGQALADQAIVTGYQVYKAGMKFAEWSGQVLKRAGEAIRPHLKAAWDQISSRVSVGAIPETKGGTTLGSGFGGLQSGFGRQQKAPAAPPPRGNFQQRNAANRMARAQKATQAANPPNPSKIGRATETVGAAQAVAQLATPGFVVRNILQHGLYGAQEKVVNTIGSAVDQIVSLAGGRRSAVLPDVKGLTEYWNGAKAAIQAQKQGKSAPQGNPLYSSQPGQSTNKVGRALDRVLYAINEVPDAGNYARHFARSVDSITKSAKRSGVNIAPEDIIAQAKVEADYLSFRNKNVVSNALSKFKETLNAISEPVLKTKKFGLGDFVVKYSQIPGAITERAAVDYSPLGLLKAGNKAVQAIQLRKSDPAKSLLAQREATLTLGRVLTGSGATVGLGAAMAAAGVLVGPDDKKKNIALDVAQSETGRRGYSLNLSALWRMTKGMTLHDKTAMKGEPESGDLLVPIEWAQPVAMQAAVGTEFYKRWKSGQLGLKGGIEATAEAGAESLAGILDHLSDQTVLKNLDKYRQAIGRDRWEDAVKAVADTAVKQVTGSFTPGLLRQARNAVDPLRRDTRAENPKGMRSTLVEAGKQFVNSTPLSPMLPTRASLTTGKEGLTRMGDSSSLGRIIESFSPLAVNRYQPDPVISELGRLQRSQPEANLSMAFPKRLEQEPTSSLRGREFEYAKKFKAEAGTMMKHPDYKDLDDEGKLQALGKLFGALRASTYKDKEYDIDEILSGVGDRREREDEEDGVRPEFRRYVEAGKEKRRAGRTK